jgi:hypothetical protein
MVKHSAFVIGLLAMVLLSGCGRSQAAEGDIRVGLDGLASEINQIIGDAACDRTDQCRIIGIGHKPCGGPAGYRAYSVTGTDVALLQSTVERFNQLSAELQAKLGILSDCSIGPPSPPARCLSRKCVIR